MLALTPREVDDHTVQRNKLHMNPRFLGQEYTTAEQQNTNQIPIVLQYRRGTYTLNDRLCKADAVKSIVALTYRGVSYEKQIKG